MPETSHVLLIEDDSDAAWGFIDLLASHEFRVSWARDGRAACEKFLSFMSDARPALILLDLGLPDMDGVDVVRRLANFCNPLPPIVVLSARSLEQLRAAAWEVSAATWLQKPFEPDTLVATVQAVIAGTFERPS